MPSSGDSMNHERGVPRQLRHKHTTSSARKAGDGGGGSSPAAKQRRTASRRKTAYSARPALCARAMLQSNIHSERV